MRPLLLLRKLPVQARVIAVVILAAIASAAWNRVRASRDTGGTTAVPVRTMETEDRLHEALSEPVEEAFAAARAADVDRYLRQFTEPALGQLDRVRKEKGDDYFRDYLTRLVKPVQGIALDFSHQQSLAPDVMKLPVELVYTDRNEVQPFELAREAGRWRIRRIQSLRSAPTLIPYGTPMEQVR